MRYFILLLWAISITGFAQSIRKSHYEMGAIERKEYNNVMRKLAANGKAGIFLSSHQDHVNYATHVFPNFIPWHRILIHHFENEAKLENKYFNLVRFNFYETNSHITFSDGSSPHGLMGYPVPGWNYNRYYNYLVTGGSGTYTVPKPSGGSNGFISDYITDTLYRFFFVTANGSLHQSHHAWIGGHESNSDIPRGTMWNVNNSPGDPLFYLHHSMVDYVFHRWLETKWNGSDYGQTSNPLSPSVSATPQNSVIGKPMYIPRSTFVNRDMKLWYAEDGKVVLDKYTASHQTLGLTTGPEFYFYTGLITVAGTMANFFTVPAGIEAKIESLSEIAILPGFSAPDGSRFGASSIGAFPTSSGYGDFRKEASETEQPQINNPASELQVFPNPNTGSFTIALPKDEFVFSMFVTDVKGANITYTRETDFEISLSQATKGIYTILIQSQTGKKYKGRVVVSF